MISTGWSVHHLPAELPRPDSPLAFAADLPGDWPGWLAQGHVPERTPFLMSPSLEYDAELNEFFRSPWMLSAAWNTQSGYARNLCAFLTFLWVARSQTSWREATEQDHLAYLVWRRQDHHGPRIDVATWDREVAAQNRFFKWQVRAGNLAVNPVPQRERRAAPVNAGWPARHETGTDTPATYGHGRAKERIEWLPARSYRRWRDVGMRGYTGEGLPNPRFRGRWAARNATFCDLMVRTGLRLSEQTALTTFDVPLGRGGGGYQRFWLPPAIAKGGSARWIYVPVSVCAELANYVKIDRADVVDDARSGGRYRRMRHPLVIEDPANPVVVQPRPGGPRRTKVSQLSWEERRRLLVEGQDGLEPAAFWLSEYGTPIAVPTWKGLFREANARCEARGLVLHVSAHMLRHTFAVITLEQLQRGHIAALAELAPEQRNHYTRIFGDPLDWVRRRLGHASVVTTQIYMHALAELEMETRMALVPDEWEDPRDAGVDAFADEVGNPDRTTA